MTDSYERSVFARPSPRDIQTAWHDVLFDPLVSLSRLRAVALCKEGLGVSGDDGGIILRSVYWRFFHGLFPPPTSLDLFPSSLQDTREAYNALRRRYLTAPDGRWASDCSGAEDQVYHEISSTGGQGDGWDPLSLDGESPWKTWFAHLDLRATIRQDVERTFPDLPYFTIRRVRTSLTTILFLYSILNPDVGYRQGMHELLAVCFLVVDRDSLLPTDSSSPNQNGGRDSYNAMMSTLDRRYVEHDAFTLYQAVMRSAKSSYEWRAEEGPRSKTHGNLPAPIITRCNHLHSSLIRRIDPQLWERLETEGVEAQIWAIRWIRLVFTREVPFGLALQLWDGIFAEDPSLEIVDFVCIAMLLLIRNELLNADYPTLLTNLLHYPSPSPQYPFNPHLIITQSVFLKRNVSPSSGVEVVIQNQDILGVKASGPERDLGEGEPFDRQRGRGGHSQGGRGRGGFSRGAGLSHGASRGGVGNLAQGLFERAQAAGLDKAILSTVADLRKNLPDSATAYSYLPNLPFSPSISKDPGFSSIPTTSPFASRSSFFPPPQTISSSQSPPPFHPTTSSASFASSSTTTKTIKDAEREVAELRLAMVGMGKALGRYLEVLQSSRRLSVGRDPELTSRGKVGKEIEEEAWNGIENVRDGLMDPGLSVGELAARWGWAEGLVSSSSSGNGTPTSSTPISGLKGETNSNVESGGLGPLSGGSGSQQIATNRISAANITSDDRRPTATASSSSRLPDAASPIHPISPTIPPSPLQQTPSIQSNSNAEPIGKVPLYLSTRDDRPSPSLPRVPFSPNPNPNPNLNPNSSSSSGPNSPVIASKSTNTKSRPWTASQYRFSSPSPSLEGVGEGGDVASGSRSRTRTSATAKHGLLGGNRGGEGEGLVGDDKEEENEKGMEDEREKDADHGRGCIVVESDPLAGLGVGVQVRRDESRRPGGVGGGGWRTVENRDPLSVWGGPLGGTSSNGSR